MNYQPLLFGELNTLVNRTLLHMEQHVREITRQLVPGISAEALVPLVCGLAKHQAQLSELRDTLNWHN